MRTFPLLLTVLVLVGTGPLSPAQQTVKGSTKPKPLCPMVTSPLEEGLCQVIEIVDTHGNKGVAEPGEKIKIRCTIINLTKRPVMVAESYVTPQYASIQAWDKVLSDELFSEGRMPAIDWKNGGILSGSVDMPRGWMDWGHIRRWIHISATHEIECGCCIRHRQYTKTVEINLPKSDWKTIALEVSQWIPAFFIDDGKRVYFESDLVLKIKRRDKTQKSSKPKDKPE